MPRVSIPKGSISFRVLIVPTILIVLGTIIFLNINGLATFCVNKLTDYTLTYDKWSGNLLTNSEIHNIRVESGKDKLLISAKDVFLDFRLKDSLKDMNIVVGCKLQDVAFGSITETSKEVSEEEGDIGDSLSGALADPFGPGQRYSKITFILLLEWDKVTLYDFQAYSKEIEIKAKEFTSTLR
jgi:hypothetical protein